MLSVDGFDGSQNIRAFVFNLFVLFGWLWCYNLNKMNLFGLSFILQIYITHQIPSCKVWNLCGKIFLESSCLLFMLHTCIDWSFILGLCKCQGTPGSEQTWNLKSKWLQWDSKPNPLSLETNSQQFRQTSPMIEFWCENLSSGLLAMCIYLVANTYWVNLHSQIVLTMEKT